MVRRKPSGEREANIAQQNVRAVQERLLHLQDCLDQHFTEYSTTKVPEYEPGNIPLIADFVAEQCSFSDENEHISHETTDAIGDELRNLILMWDSEFIAPLIEQNVFEPRSRAFVTHFTHKDNTQFPHELGDFDRAIQCMGVLHYDTPTYNDGVTHNVCIWYFPNGKMYLGVENDVTRKNPVEYMDIFSFFKEYDSIEKMNSQLPLMDLATKIDEARQIESTTALSFKQALVSAYHKDGYTKDQISRYTGITKNSVGTHLNRSQNRYDECIEQLEEVQQTLKFLQGLF